MNQVSQAPSKKQQRVIPDDDWKVLDEIGNAFKDVPLEEIEREIAKAVSEVREEDRRRTRRNSRAL